MPNIKPISALRNYTEILKQVDTSNRVYLTRNGHGEYGILTMAEIDELDRCRAAYILMSRLRKAGGTGQTKRAGFLQRKLSFFKTTFRISLSGTFFPY